jgi:competence protein ComEA
VIVVSVTGLVRHPGVVRLAFGARVADAIKAAGGVVGDGDITGMNLATKLTDGASVVVGAKGGTVAAIGSSASGSVAGSTPMTSAGATVGGTVGPTVGPTEPLDLNTADATALDGLPGVGPVTAAAIVAYRTDHGPFTSVDQLQAISGIGPAKYAKIAPHVTVGSTPP